MSELYRINKSTIDNICNSLREVTDLPQGTKFSEIGNIIPSLENIKYNMGSEEKAELGYIKSNSLTSTPKGIEITSQAEYLLAPKALPPTLPEIGTDQCSVAYGDYIYTFGGWSPVEGDSLGTTINTITKFNIKTEELTVLTKPLPILLSGQVGAVVRDKIYLFGGYSTDNGGVQTTVLMFDPATEDTEITSYVLPEARLNGALGVWGDDIYIMGGRRSDALLPVVHFNPVTGVMENLNVNIPVGVYYCGFTQDDEKLYVVGGRQSNGIHVQVIQYFDHITMTTGTLVNVPTPIQAAPSIIIDNHLFFFSASWESSKKYMNVYDYNLWTGEIKDIYNQLGMDILVLSGFYSIGNILYVFGGQGNTASTSYFTNKILKICFDTKVEEEKILLHISSAGKPCKPFIGNNINIFVQIDGIYIGNSSNRGQKLTDATVYLNGVWAPIK